MNAMRTYDALVTHQGDCPGLVPVTIRVLVCGSGASTPSSTSKAELVVSTKWFSDGLNSEVTLSHVVAATQHARDWKR